MRRLTWHRLVSIIVGEGVGTLFLMSQEVICIMIAQVMETVRELNGEPVIEYDTGEWSVDIGFPGHKVAIEVRPSVKPGLPLFHNTAPCPTPSCCRT